MNLGKIKTLREVQEEFQKDNTEKFCASIGLMSLEPSELNRVFMMYSNSSGVIRKEYIRKFRAHLDKHPDRAQRRMRSPVDQSDEKNRVSRSRLVDQFYSHQLPGIDDDASSAMRSFVEKQKMLEKSAINCTELINSALDKLAYAFHGVHKDGNTEVQNAQAQVFAENKQDNAIKCPTKYMESSVAVILEFMENISMNILAKDAKI